MHSSSFNALFGLHAVKERLDALLRRLGFSFLLNKVVGHFVFESLNFLLHVGLNRVESANPFFELVIGIDFRLYHK